MKTKDIIRTTGIVLLFLVLTTPLLFSDNFFFPYITLKNFVFRALVEGAALAYLFLLLKDWSYRPKKSFIAIALLSFVAVMGIATIFSEYPYKSFWSDFERMEGYIMVLHLALYVIALGTMIVTESLWEWFFEASLFVSLIVGANALLDLGKGIDRIYGTLGNSTYLGVYALIHIFLAGFMLVKLVDRNVGAKKTQSYWISFYKYIAFALFNTYIMYQTGTRGSFVGLVAGILVISVLLAIFEKNRKVLRKVGIGILVATFAGIVLLGITKNTPFVKNSLLGRYSTLISLNPVQVFHEQGFGRDLIWHVAWEGVKERPIIGWGQESFNYVFNKYYTPNLWTQEQWFDRAHNVFLDWLIAGGILGLLSYLSLYVAFLWSVWKTSSDRLSTAAKSILTGLLVAYFFHNLFVFDNLASYILFFALLAYAYHLRVHTDTPDPRAPQSKALPLAAQYSIGIVGTLIFFFVFYFVLIKPFEANTSLLSALEDQSIYSSGLSQGVNDQSYLQDAYNEYDKALGYNTFGTPEIREQLAVAAGTVVSTASSSIQTLFVGRTESEFQNQLMRTPEDARYYSIYGNFLSQIGDYNQSLVELQKAHDLSPGKQEFLFDIGLVYISLKQYDQAYAILQTAYGMATDNPTGQILYAVGAIYDKQDMVVDHIIDLYPSVVSDTRFAEAYISTGQEQKLIPILKSYIASNPGTNIPLYLAGTYLQIGDTADAITTLQSAEASTTDPQLTAELQYYINAINKGLKSMFSQ